MNDFNFEQTQEDLRIIRLQILDLLKYSNPTKYAEFVGQMEREL